MSAVLAPPPGAPLCAGILEDWLRQRDAFLVEREMASLDTPGRLVDLRRLSARPARFSSTEHPLPARVADRMGVDRLWCHQARALDLARSGRSVALATPTASGKSLVHQVLAAEAALDDRPGTSLWIFPTKALAHDQLRAVTERGFEAVVAGAYDGDCGREERRWVRDEATVVATNPEMLHCGILPGHARWARMLGRLRYVVVDEMHVFRGVFGSHVAHVLRRLRRLANHYGADPVFVASSATIADAGPLASALTGLDVEVVDDDGSPAGERVVAVWNPPVIDADRGVRVSAHSEVAGLVADAVRAGRRAIGFCPSRRSTETVAMRTRDRAGDRASRVRAYRGGYLADERHEIERALAEGELDAVLTTSALELGVDLPEVDTCVVDGFPGTMASLWQRFGRAGRGQAASLSILVCGTDQLDQWVAAHPDALFAPGPERAVVNPSNPFILDPHLRAAAFELPLTHADEAYWPGMLDDGVRRLAGSGDLAVRRDGRIGRGGRRRGGHEPVATFVGRGWPVDEIGLRSGAAGEVKIVRDDGSDVGTVSVGRATSVVHPGAVYVHQGRSYEVAELDLDRRRAVVSESDGGTYTVTRSTVELEVLGTDEAIETGPVTVGLGPVRVRTVVRSFQRRDASTHEVLGGEALELPPAELETRGVRLSVAPALLRAAAIDAAVAPGALHAAEHAAIGVLPLFAICDRWDVGGVSTTELPGVGGPGIVIYDGYPGGAGIAELGFAQAARHWQVTSEVVDACPCRDGCPACVQSPKCGNGNQPLDKAAAARLLRVLLEHL